MQRDQMRVIRDHEYAVAEQRHAAVDPAGCVADQALRTRAAVMPDLPAAARIEGERFIHRRDVHDAAGDEGRALEIARGAPNVEHPLGRQALHIAGVDLIERAEPIAGLVSVVGRPRARLRPHHIGEGDPSRRVRSGETTEIGGEVARLRRSRRLDRRFLACHLGDLILHEQVQRSVDTQQLQVERALVPDQATDGSAVAQAHRDRALGEKPFARRGVAGGRITRHPGLCRRGP